MYKNIFCHISKNEAESPKVSESNFHFPFRGNMGFKRTNSIPKDEIIKLRQ
jgi:hypothetical protein